MGRRFTAASSERIQIGSTGLNGLNFQYGTFAICCYVVSHTVYGSPFSTNTGSMEMSITDTSGVLAWWDGTNEHDGTTAVTLNESMILAWTKTTGLVVPNVHLYRFSTNTWVHQAASAGSGGNILDGATTTAATLGSYQDAATSDALDAEVWAMASWNKVVMSDSEIERLARGDWLRSQPDFYTQWSDGREVGDMTRTLGRYPARQTARTGTTRGAQKPPPGFRLAPQARRR